MIRRDFLRLSAFAAAALGLSGHSQAASALCPSSGLVIFDGRFRQARIFAARALAGGAGQALDCRMDAALLWHRRCSGRIDASVPVVGITGMADAMILADCTRRDGRILTRTEIRTPDGLIIWSLTQKPAKGAPSRT